MSQPILITGGTGTLGSSLVPMLQDKGCELRVLSRHDRDSTPGVEYVIGDLDTGAGIEAAVNGVETIVHLAGSNKGDDVKTRTLVEAARRTGTPHIVYISVVGADRIPVTSRTDRVMSGYFAAKRASELVIAESGLPWTTVRATQFHDLLLATVRQLAKLPVVPVPAGVRFQPVDTREVAVRLVELSLGEPAGLVPDIAGPQVYEMKDLVRSYLRATGKRRLLVPVRLPGKAARAFREGANLALDRAVGLRTWDELLAERVSST